MLIKIIGKFRDGTDKKTLEPEAPFKWVTNSNEDVFSKFVALGRNDNESNWRDATQEEYEEWERRQEEPEESEEN